MAVMLVTLAVSKLSGWLKADARCRGSKEGLTCWASCGVSRREAAGDGGARSVQGRARLQIGAGHGEERTFNMELMYVTLEVSKLSGWLNDAAPCRGSKEGHTVWGK